MRAVRGHAQYLATWLTLLKAGSLGTPDKDFNVKLDYLLLDGAELVIRDPRTEEIATRRGSRQANNLAGVRGTQLGGEHRPDPNAILQKE